VATLAQGFVLGGFIQGVTLDAEGGFAGGAFDWLTPYTALVALGLVAGYMLLGATWLVWRTETELHGQARRWAWIAAAATAGLLALVSLATLFVHPRVAERWGVADGALDLALLAPRLPIPLLGLAGLALLAWSLARGRHGWPFLAAILVFLSGYAGLAAGFFPNIVPYDMSFRQAASADNALGLMLVGVAILLPTILGYTVYSYWLFRGKVTADAGYH
jgi:cytochrome d ubiquinol oxidase subunit II